MARILNIDYVICPYCNEEFPTINYKHLKKHNKTLADLRKDFPETIEVCKNTMDKRKAGNKRGNTANKIKIIQCCYCNCNMEVRNNEANNQACQSCLNKGLENPDGRRKNQANERRTKKLQKKYGEGVINAAHVPGVKEAKIKTNNERYGGVGFASQLLKQKTKQTTQEKYGVDNWRQTDEGRTKARIDLNTQQSHNNSISSRKENAKPYPYKGMPLSTRIGEKRANEMIEIAKTRERKKATIDIFEKMPNYNVKLVDDKYLGTHHRHNFKCLTCGEIFNTSWFQIQNDSLSNGGHGYRCPKCYPRQGGKSMGELEIVEFIKELFPEIEVIQNDRKKIAPKELDVYIPSLGIAIEFNGIYSHSSIYHYVDKSFDKHKHVKKTMACENMGIKLIHITDYQWINIKPIIKETLKRTLGFDNVIINESECLIKVITKNDKNNFLRQYHLEGVDYSNVALGAFTPDNELVAIMTFKESIKTNKKYNENRWELHRVATKFGFYESVQLYANLLTHFKEQYTWDKIHAMDDRSWSSDNLYIQLGFTFVGNGDPEYYLVDYNGHIYSRHMKNIKANTGKYYDCGQTRFLMKKDSLITESDIEDEKKKIRITESIQVPSGMRIDPCVNCGTETEHSAFVGVNRVLCQTCKDAGVKVKLDKVVNCYYCKKEFEINLRAMNKFSICPECSAKGLKNPKASENAIKANNKNNKMGSVLLFD